MAGSEVGRIFYTLDLDNTQFKKGVAESTAESESFGNKLESVGKKAAIAFAVVGVAAVAFAKSAIQSWQDHELVAAQTEAVIKSTGGAAGYTAKQIEELGYAFEKTTRYSHDQVAAAEDILLTFTNIHKETFPQTTQAVLDLSTAMHMDLQSASVMVGKAMQDPLHGMMALSRVGALNRDDFNRLNKEWKGGTVPLMQEQKELLQALNKEFAGSAEAAGNTFAGKLDKLKNSFNDLKEGIGHFLVNALVPLADKFSNFIAAINAAGGPLAYLHQQYEKHKAMVASLAFIIGGILVAAVVSLATALWAAVAPLLPFIAIGALVGYVLNDLAQKFGGWHQLISIVEGKLRTIGQVMSDIFMPVIQQIVAEFRDQLWPQLKRLWETLEPGLTTVLKIVAAVIGVVLVSAMYVWLQVGRLVIQWIADMISWISSLIQWFINAYNWADRTAHDIINAFKSIKQGISDSVSLIGVIISNAFSAAVRTVEGFFDTMYHSGIRLIQSLGRGIADGVHYAVDAAKGVLNKVRNMLPFSDAKEGPLSDLTLSGQRFSETFAAGITHSAGAIQDAANKALSVGSGTGGIGGLGGTGGGGTSISNSIGIIHINSAAEGQNWLGQLTRSDQLISMGLSG